MEILYLIDMRRTAKSLLLIFLGVMIDIGCLTAADIYVDAVNGSDTGDGITPKTAKETIQSAIDTSKNGDVVLVAKGEYGKWGVIENDIHNRLFVNKDITIKSLSGPEATSIVATSENGKSARGVYMKNNSSLVGFTIKGGNLNDPMGNGGGIYCESKKALIENCIISDNTASFKGGGVYGGNLKNCIITRNRLTEARNDCGGAGASGAVLEACKIIGNKGARGEDRKFGYGGGVFNCELKNCDVIDNSSHYAGGAYKSKLEKCRIIGNSAHFAREASECEIADSTVGADLTQQSDIYLNYLGKCNLTGNVRSYFSLKLPSVIGSNMVLQQNMDVPIWGWSNPGNKITVTFENQTFSATAAEDSKWRISLKPLKANKNSQSMTISVENAEKIVLENILVGEVWLCSGQSNMWHTMSVSTTKEEDYEVVPGIRLFGVELDKEAKWEKRQENCTGLWSIGSKARIQTFSAVGYYFGKKLYADLDVPIGLIRSAIGDSMAEAWTSDETLRKNPVNNEYLAEWGNKISSYNEEKAVAEYNEKLKKWDEMKIAASKDKLPPQPVKPLHPMAERNRPSRLFNGYISPLIPFAIRGVIYYQGEANVRRPLVYSKVFQDLIIDWRKNWNRPDMPFLFVQLPNFGREIDAVLEREDGGWPIIREAQADALKLPNTGMAITIDVGEANDIHPRNKRPVGERLALLAEKLVYNKNIPCWSGPLYDKISIHENKITVKFKHTGDGLTFKGGEPQGFFIAEDDKIFYKAKAIIRNDTVELWSDSVPNPKIVRYAWAGNPVCNLYNSAGLPASPFRTDRNSD